MGKSRRKNQGAKQEQSASSSVAPEVESSAQELGERAASVKGQPRPATGVGPGAAAQAQMLTVAQTQGNAAAQAALGAAGRGAQEDEDGGHATEEPKGTAEAADSPGVPSPEDEEKSAAVDGGSEASGGGSGGEEPPVGTEALSGGEPNPTADSEVPPELGIEEEEGDKPNAHAESDEQKAEEGQVAPAEQTSGAALTAPLMPSMTPTMGVGAAPTLVFGVEKEEEQALVETTGMGAKQHAVVGNTALSGLANSAASLQAEAVEAAENAGLTVRSTFEAMVPVVGQEVASVDAQVAHAFDSGAASVQGAAGAARAQVDVGTAESQAGVAAKHTEDVGQIDAVATATQAELTTKKQAWSQSFDTLESGYAEKFEKAPEAASDAVLARKEAIGEEQASGKGPGGAVTRLMDKKRTQAGVLQAEQAAERIRVEGKVLGPKPVEEIGEPGMVEEWVEPLNERVGTFRQDSITALTETAETSKEAIATGGEEWKSQIELDEQSAVAQMTDDKSAAQAEVSLVGVQLKRDLESQIVTQESLFTEASAQFADSYRLHVETVAEEVAILPLVTGEEAEEYAARQESVLDELHQENLTTLTGLVDTTTTELLDQVDTGRGQLQSLLSANQGDIEELTTAKVESFDEMGVCYSDSLGSMSEAIQDDMQRWTDPLESQSTNFVEAAETSLQGQHDSADKELKQKLGTYEQGLAKTVSEVGQHVDADPAGTPADETLEKICEESKVAMNRWGTEENQLYNALRKIEDRKKSPEFAQAVETKWKDVNNVDNKTLLSWIDGDMDGSEYQIAYNYYKGNTSKAAELELNYCIGWFVDDEKQVETVLRGLDKDQLVEMQARDTWKAVGQQLQDDLDGTDLNVVDALLVNNKSRADAYRLKDKVDAARRKGNHDALHDALAGMDPATRQTIVQEFSYIREDNAVAGAKNVKLPDWEKARDQMKEYVTRDIDQNGSNNRIRKITGANKNLAEALIEHGNDSIETDAHRFEVERTRKGGPKESRMEEALYMSKESQQALRRGEVEPEYKKTDAYQAALKEKQKRTEFEEVYAKHNYNDGKTVKEGMEDLYKGQKNGKLEVEVHKKMLEDGTNSPEVVALITELSTRGYATRDERLQRAWTELTPAQAKEAKEIWKTRPDLGAGRDLDHFLFNSRFSELSGDEAQIMKEKTLGDEKYMNDEQRLELANLRADFQLEGQTSLSDDEASLKAHREELQRLVATVKAERTAKGFEATAFDAKGVFLGTEKQKKRYAQLFRYVGMTARQEKAHEDSTAAVWTQAIAITGGTVVVVLTAGAATPLVIGGVTAATGVAGIGANAVIKGNRYGYEQAMLDGGVTVVSALTAGYGAHLSRLNDVAKGGTGIVLAGRKLSENTGKIYISVVTAGTDGLAGAVLNDKTWEESGGGWSDVVLATAKGAGLDYAGGFLGDAVDGIPTIPQFADKGSTMMARLSQAAQVVVNAPQDAVKGYVEDFLKEGLSLSFDKATGKYQGDFGDVLVAMNEAGFKGAGTGMLNRFIKRVTPEKAFEGKKSEEGSTKSIGDEPGEVSELVAKHPDVVEQLDHLEASEEASSEKAKQDDADQAERIEQVGGEETPEASAQTLEEVSQEKEAMVEQRSQEGQEEIADFVEVVSETEKTVEAEVDAEAKKAQEAIDKAAAQQSLDNASAPDATPALSDEEIAHTVLESLNLSPEAGANFSSLDEQEVAALVEHHKAHGDAGRILQDPDRLRQVVSSTREVDSTLETPVDLNTASVEELQSLHGIGPAYAKRIVEEREKRPFSSAEDMADRVSGVASVVLDNNAERMRVSKPTSDESVAAEGPSELDAENQSSETAMFQRDSTRAGYGPKDGLESSHPRAESLHPEDLREGQKIVYQDHVVTVQRIDDQLLLIPEGDFGFFSMTTEEFYTHTGRTPPPQRVEVPNHEDNTMIIHRLTQQDTEYVSGGGDQRVVVDLEGDAALQDALAAARKASGTGSIDEQIALLTNHVHQDIEYDKQSIGADEVSKDLLKAYREAKNNNDVQAANQLAQAYRHHVADSRRQSRYDADPDGRVNLGEMVTNDAVVCREKAIFMHVALADMGIESQVVIGKVSVDNGSGAAGGHAWVVLADGTVIDGTWGAIYPGGQNYPVHSERERRVFAAPNGAVDPAEAQKGAQRASGILEDPGAISKLRTQAEDPSARGDSPSQGNTAQSVDGEEVLEPARPLRPDEMGTFYDRNGNPIKPGEVRDAKFVHPDDLRVGDRILLDGHEMTVQSKDEVIHLMTDFQGHRFLSPEDFIRATQGDAAADYYLSDEAKTQPIARMPDGDQTRMLSLDELRKQASPSQETDAQPEESDQKRSGNQKEEVDSWTKKGLEATYSGHLQEEHLEGFRQAERAREQQILEDISNSWKALSDTDRAEALSRARKAFPNLKDESVQALEKCLQNFKNDGEFSSLPTMDGSRESAYTILNFERLLLEAAAIPEGPLLRITDGAYNQFGDARVDDQGELLKQQTYATPAGAVLDGVSVMDLTPEAYARSMGIIEDTSKWGETSSLLADYMGGGRMEGETDQQVRTRWVRAVEDQYGGFKEMKYLSVTLDAAELAQHIRYSSPHLVSGYAEVTLRPLDASAFEGLGLLDIELSQNKTIGESLRTALAGELNNRGKPELAAEVEGMSAADLARVLKSDIADPQKLRSHLGG